MKNLYKAIFSDYESKLSDDEWYLSKKLAEINDDLNSMESFELLPDAIDTILELEDSLLIWYMINFMISIYRKVNTTEVHTYLKNNLKDFEKHIKNHDDSCINAYEDLCKYLRIE